MPRLSAVGISGLQAGEDVNLRTIAPLRLLKKTLGRPKFSCPPTGGLLSPNTASGQALRCQTMPSRAYFW